MYRDNCTPTWSVGIREYVSVGKSVGKEEREHHATPTATIARIRVKAPARSSVEVTTGMP